MVAWEFEQIRSAIAALWPWLHVDLDKPLEIFAVKDEKSMKALAPQYWEKNDAVHPVSVWGEGADQNYLALRTDVLSADNWDRNPYQQAYFSYASLILMQTLPANVPLWFRRGFAAVLSNTVVRQQKLLLGPPIRGYLSVLGSGARLTVAQLLAVDGNSPELRTEEGLRRFDAESWALVHFLMFADNGARWSKLDQYLKLVDAGTSAAAAFHEALGSPEDVQRLLWVYISKNVYTFRQFNLDASVKREGFTVTQVGPADAASRRALFCAAMGRPVESRAAIDEARKAGPAPDSWVAEGLLLDRENKADAASAAYAHAAEAGTTDAYAYYRLARLAWRGEADSATLQKVKGLLGKAVALNNRYAAAYSMLGEAQSILGDDAGVGMALRATSLEPTNAYYHLAAARVLERARKFEQALQQAQSASALAPDDAVRREAGDVSKEIERAKGGS